MKRANLLFFCLLIYCCIQGRGNSERHWYWVPRDPMRVTPQLSNEHVFLHLSSKCVTGLEVTLGSALLCKKKIKNEMPQCFREPAVFTPGLSQWGQFLALRLWSFGERRFEKSLAMFLPASLGLLRTVCSLRAGTNSFHTFCFFFIAFLDAVCSAMGQFTLGLKPWQHLIYSALLQNNVRTG